LFNYQLMLEGDEWQVAQFGVQLHAIVEADDVIRDAGCRLGMVGVFALPNPRVMRSRPPFPIF
jgi:hypothetical protein